MKKTIIAALFATSMFTTVQANDEQIPNLNMDKCIEISEFAQDVMSGRQNGEPMTNYLNVENPPYANYKSMVITAYKMQRYSSEDYKTQAVEEFVNMSMLTCISAMEKRGIEY